MTTISHLIEIPGYDGYSITVMSDGTWVNRWADPEDPTQAIPGYERRFEMTEDYMNAYGMDGSAP